MQVATDSFSGSWDARSLHRLLELRFPRTQMIAVSNRQHCSHEHGASGIELFEGMLGCSIAGFQTTDHTANFLARIDRRPRHSCDPQRRLVRHNDQLTLVRFKAIG